MHTLTLLLALFAVDSLSLLSPGPNVLLLTQAAVEHGRRHALLVTLGLAAGGLTWALIALTGLSALFEVMPSVQTAIRVAGGAYLLYLSVRLWRSRHAPQVAAVAPPVAAQPGHKAFLKGLATSLLNPKALAYFGSIFVVLVPADASATVRSLAAGLVCADALLWYGLASMLFSMPRIVRGYLSLRRPIDRACAAFMAVFGLKLIL